MTTIYQMTPMQQFNSINSSQIDAVIANDGFELFRAPTPEESSFLNSISRAMATVHQLEEWSADSIDATWENLYNTLRGALVSMYGADKADRILEIRADDFFYRDIEGAIALAAELCIEEEKQAQIA